MAENLWDVEFARFFNYLRLSSASQANLHPLLRKKAGNGDGTWILAESIAVVRISSSANAITSPVISVTVEGFVVEEHFVSSLHFSWPQISCVSQCPIRGSRAVFLSYTDNTGQIQKFAVRFRTSCDAENFLNSVKECFHKTADTVPVGCDVVCENSSPPDFSASNALNYSFEEPIATQAPEIPALTYKDTPNEVTPSPSGLPPSFTELLTKCVADTGKEQCTAEENVKHKTSKVSVPNQPVKGGFVLPYFMGDADLKSQIAKYMADDSFQDMLFKIEKVIDEMGGDLVL